MKLCLLSNLLLFGVFALIGWAFLAGFFLGVSVYTSVRILRAFTFYVA